MVSGIIRLLVSGRTKMKVLLGLTFVLWIGADASYNTEPDASHPPENAGRQYDSEDDLCRSPFVAGKTHRYELTINMTAGIPGLTNQVAKSLIQMYVSITSRTENDYVLKAEYVKVSESRSHVDSGDAFLPLRPLPELERDLAQPIRFTYEHGEVRTYTLGSTESLPSRSIKRSILRHLQMKLDPSLRNPRRGEDYPEYYPVTYSTTERDEVGSYEAIYTVTVSPSPEHPYEDKLYNITKVHNYEPYGYPAYYERHNFAKQGCPEAYAAGDCSTHNLYGAGRPVGYEPTPLKSFKVVYHNLRYINGKYVLLENIQVKEKSIATMYDQDLVVSIESRYELKEVSDRIIEDPREQQTQFTELNTVPTAEELRREQPRDSEYVTQEYMFIHGIFNNARSHELVIVAQRILEKVSDSIVAAKIEGTRGQEVTEDVVNLQDVLGFLKKPYLDAVYRKVPEVRTLRSVPEKEKVKRQIFLDVLPLAGTEDSVEYIRNLIQERKLLVWEAKAVLEAIPANLIQATKKNVQDLLALTELPYVEEHYVLHSAAYLTVSDVMREAYVVPRFYGYYSEAERSCHDNQREKRCKYQEESTKSKNYGPYYNEEEGNRGEPLPRSYGRREHRQSDETLRYGEVTLRRYIKKLQSKLQLAKKLSEKIVYIEALARLGYKKSLKALESYVYGYARDTEEYSPADVDYLKTVVIYALHHTVEYYPKETQEVVAPVYFNRAEAPRVRIAAFSVLLRSQPSLAVLQHVAQDSHDEPSNEVGSYVYSALQNYGNASTPCLKLTADRIKLVISQTRSYDIGAQYSKSFIWTFFDEFSNFGLEKHFAVVQSNESYFPSTLYTSLKYNIQSMSDVLYKAKLNIQGVTADDLLRAMDYQLLRLKLPSHIPQQSESQIFRSLNLLPRLPKELRIIFYKKIFYSSSYHYIDAQSKENDLIAFLEYMRYYFIEESGSVRGHFVKTYIPSSYQSLTYSSIGFPVEFRMKKPFVLSLKMEFRKPHRDSGALAFYIRPSVYYATYYKHSIFNTGVRRAYGVYQEQKLTATFPVELSVYYNQDANTVEVSYKLPQVPKRIYRHHSEAGTYENDLKLRYVLSAEENREPIRTIPALFQCEQVVHGFGLPSLYVTRCTEDIENEYMKMPQNLQELVANIVETLLNPGYRRRDMNATIVTKPSSPVDQVKFVFSYNRTYDAPAENEYFKKEPSYQENDVREISLGRHMKYSRFHSGSSAEDEYSVVSRIFPRKHLPQGHYEEITPAQAHKLYEAFSESLNKVTHELYIRVETSPSENVAELRVEYNHTFDRTLHNFRAEVGAFSAERRMPYKMYLTHVMRYAHNPNAFKYEPRAYVGQHASFFNAINFGEHPRSYDQSDVIAQGTFVKVPADEHFSRDEFVERPEREAFSPKAQNECKKDVEEGKSQSPACVTAVEEDARLNKVYVRVTARQDLPPAVQNLTYKLEDAIKYYYYSRAEINRVNVNNPPRTFEMVINYIDKLTDKHVLDVYMKKPSENVIYHKVDFEYLKPLSSVYTLPDSYILWSTNHTYPPSCGLMEKYVRTYDMKMYSLPRDGCTYVLSTHCTERKKFTVLVKRVSASDDYKEVYVYVADQRVVLKPEKSSAGFYSIVHNNRTAEVRTPLLLDEDNLLYVHPVSVYDETVKHVIVLRAERARVKLEYDGKNVKLEVSPMYKGELCGLCSEYDGEITGEYLGPNQCLYLDSEDFARSSIIDAETCGVRTEPKNSVLCPHDKHRVQYRSKSYPSTSPYRSDSYGRPHCSQDEGDDSEEKCRYDYVDEDDNQGKYRYPDGSESSSQDKSIYPNTSEEDYEGNSLYPFVSRMNSEPKERTVYHERGQKMCFSTQPVTVCEEGYTATEEYEKSVDYHCLPKNDVSTKRLIEESKERVLRELSSKKVDYSESFSAAKYCSVY